MALLFLFVLAATFAALNIIAEGVTFSEGIPQDIGQQLINVDTYV